MKAKLLKKLKLIRDESYQYSGIFYRDLYLTTLLLNGFINVDVIGFYPRLVKYVYGHSN